ncbi:hypothetical protein K1Y80_43905, partial [Streptomyces sp. MAG02]|nr:hypothetical protein [Streptomyces sp. MAG02]
MSTDNQCSTGSSSGDAEPVEVPPQYGVTDLPPGPSRTCKRPVVQFLAGAGTFHPLLSLLAAMVILGVGQAGFDLVLT